MTRARFDPRLINIYKEPRLLLHFEWGTDNKIYRYALVEKIDIGNINELTKNVIEIGEKSPIFYFNFRI